MTVEIKLSRRSALLGAAALPLIGSASMLVGGAHAGGHSVGKANVPYSHYKVGDFIVTTLLSGSSMGSEP